MYRIVWVSSNNRDKVITFSEYQIPTIEKARENVKILTSYSSDDEKAYIPRIQKVEYTFVD